MSRSKLFLSVLAVPLLLLSACATTQNNSNSANTTADGGKKLNVVTTVAPLTNIALNVGGDRINLRGLIPEGTDSHTFEPAPSDAKWLSDADIILVNGLHLESPTERLAENTKKQSAVLYHLGDNTITEQDWVFDFSFPKDKGDPNPHLWMNPLYAKKYAELMRDQLKLLDPANKEYYQSNTARFVEKIDALDKAITTAINTIPEKNRKLLTYHDSFAYFAKRYPVTIVGAIQPSDFKEPSPQDVAALIDQLKQEQIPAIFGSEVFPSKVLDQIGKEASVKWIDTLRDDDLPGAKDAPNHTYVGMMVEDVTTMVSALGGNPEAMNGIDPKNVAK